MAAPRPASTQVVLFATHAAPGGIKELWESLADGLRAHGYDTSLQALYRHEEDVPSAGNRPWNYIMTGRHAGATGALHMIVALALWLWRTRPAVVISAMPAANILLPLLARLFSPATRIIETHHTPIGTYHPLLRRLSGSSQSMNNVAFIVGVSRAVLASLPAATREKQRHKALVIPNAMAPEIETLLATLAPTHERIAASRNICAVGRLSEQKNYSTLIRAASLLPADVQIDIIGGGPEETALKSQIADLGLQARVRLLGHRSRAETLKRLAAADVFVQISRWEGHSLALIEAAKLYLPLIVSDVPVQIEGVMAQDGTACGLIAGVDNAEDIADKMTMLLDDPAAYRLWSDKARRLGSEFSFDAMCYRYCQLIERATEAR
ncbi:glycosyltransferase family 4 protein [Sphingobium aromaticiconvertens]|uniref:glycosyltransferase family 4 protein n=1 Tax=Sphingobium aromaticiconvertens TaxID=365341 RepID=UPI003015A165